MSPWRLTALSPHRKRKKKPCRRARCGQLTARRRIHLIRHARLIVETVAFAWEEQEALRAGAIAPDIPTLGVQGYPGAEADMWYGLFGPANLPEPIVAKLNKALNDALADAETRNALEKQGLEVGPSTPAEFKALVEKENAKWKQATTAAGLVAE